MYYLIQVKLYQLLISELGVKTHTKYGENSQTSFMPGWIELRLATIIRLPKAMIHYPAFHATAATVGGNQSIKRRVEWMVAYDWSSPTVAASSCTKNCVVFHIYTFI